MRKKVLLVGTSYSAVPILFYLKAKNYVVSVCGGIDSDPCHRYADGSYNIDYSNRELLLDLVSSEKFDFIIPSCNDYAYLSAAWVAQKLNFPGYDDFKTTVLLHTKNEFRVFTQKNNLPVPKIIRTDNEMKYDEKLLKFPLLVKPIDSFSGRGVSKVTNEIELKEAIEVAQESSNNKEVVIEDFIEGTLHSHSAFIVDGKIKIDIFADEYCTVYPYQVNCSNIPSSLSKDIFKSIRESMQKIVDLLKLNDGLLHTQFIVENSTVWIIECMRRCPGDLYNKMVSDATEMDYLGAYVSPYLNEKITIQKTSIKKYIGRHTISVDKKQEYFSFSESIPAINTELITLKLSGEKLEEAPYDKLGITFSQFSDMKTLFKSSCQLEKYIKIKSVGNI